MQIHLLSSSSLSQLLTTAGLGRERWVCPVGGRAQALKATRRSLLPSMHRQKAVLEA